MNDQSDGAYPRLQALYVPMRDRVRIALDLWLPSKLRAGETVGTIMRSTRYWRARGQTDPAIEKDSNFEMAQVFNESGYAHVIVDARGTGASFGMSTRPWSDDEIADYGEIVDWIAAQPWSNGRVVTTGISYDANTAEATAIPNPNGLKAVVPRFSDFDFYHHVLFPGGVCHEWLAQSWSDHVRRLDDNDICAVAGLAGDACTELKRRETGVKPVGDDLDGRLLAAAVDEHSPNPSVFDALNAIMFRDDPYDGGASLEQSAMQTMKGAIESSGVAYQAWASWLDAGTQLGVLSRFNTFSNPQEVIIGAWSHGARAFVDPFVTRDVGLDPDVDAQRQRILQFVAPHLRDNGSPPLARSIHYYTMGAGSWRTTPVWPPVNVAVQRWHVEPAGTLSTMPSYSSGSDEYQVDFSATTGTSNRWHTQLGGGPVLYPDRTSQSAKMLVYRSDPLSSDLEVTGHPIVTLSIASTHEDGAFYVYLEAVDEQDEVTYITEGQLRGIHRRVSDTPAPFATYGPIHTFRRSDAAPLTPGEVTTLEFELFPTSALFRKGTRIQLGIAGHDADTFRRVPSEGNPTITVYHQGTWIDLPVVTH